MMGFRIELTVENTVRLYGDIINIPKEACRWMKMGRNGENLQNSIHINQKCKGMQGQYRAKKLRKRSVWSEKCVQAHDHRYREDE